MKQMEEIARVWTVIAKQETLYCEKIDKTMLTVQIERGPSRDGRSFAQAGKEEKKEEDEKEGAEEGEKEREERKDEENGEESKTEAEQKSLEDGEQRERDVDKEEGSEEVSKENEEEEGGRKEKATADFTTSAVKNTPSLLAAVNEMYVQIKEEQRARKVFLMAMNTNVDNITDFLRKVSRSSRWHEFFLCFRFSLFISSFLPLNQFILFISSPSSLSYHNLPSPSFLFLSSPPFLSLPSLLLSLSLSVQAVRRRHPQASAGPDARAGRQGGRH